MKAKIVNTLSAVWAVVICSVLGLVACQDYSIDSQPVGKSRVVCDALEQYNAVATDADNIIFNVSANTPWKITVATNDADKSWCIPSPAASAVNGLVSEVVVKITDNPNDTPREATLTLTADDVEEPIVVKVVQDSKSALRVSGDAVDSEFAVGGETKVLQIRANRAWEIIFDNEEEKWLRAEPAYGEAGENIEVRITADPNGGVVRTASFTVTAGASSVQRTVKQKGAMLEVEESALAVLAALPSNGGLIEVPVNASMDWTVESTETWVKDIQIDNGKFTFTCEENIYFIPRSGVITLKGGSLSVPVEITQSIATFYCWGKSDQIIQEFPAEQITEKGLLLKGNDEFRVAFDGGKDGGYRNGTYTWEFEEISVSAPLLLTAGNNYNRNDVPNMDLLFHDSANSFNAANDWRVNGLGYWLTWQNVSTLRENYAAIKKIVMKFTSTDITCWLYDVNGELLDSKTGSSTTNWGDSRFGYSLYFVSVGSEDDYCIVKSFKAEPEE